MSNIAFIGLGAMGEPMAANLLDKGHAVRIVGTRSREAVGRLEALGAAVADTPADAARGCATAVLALPTSREVQDVVTGPQGLRDGLGPGSVVVDCTTGDPAVTRGLAATLAESEIGLVDAGLTRGVAGARNGKLAYFVGGKSDHIEMVKPVLEAMGDTFFVMGGVGTGHETKILSNALSYGTVALVNETLMLGRAFGLDLEKLHGALMAGAMSKALESFGPTIISGNFETPRVSVQNVGIHLDVLHKLASASETPLFVTAAAQEVFRLAAARGDGPRDMAVVSEIWTKAKN